MTPNVEAALREAEEIQLVTTGRRTGRPHTVTLWSAYDEGALWLRADANADWYRNVLADPRCRVRFDRHDVAGTCEPLADQQQSLRHVIGLWRSKYGNEWVGDWYVERGRIPVRVLIVQSG